MTKKHVTVQTVYVVNHRVSKHEEQNLILLIREIHKSIIIHRGVNSSLSKIINM